MKDIVIIGAGGFGREVAWLIEDINKNTASWNLLGFVDDNEELIGTLINGYEVLGDVEWLSGQSLYVVSAIGDPKTKKITIERLKKSKNKYPILIHPSVIYSDKNKIGEGSIICAGNILTVNIEIGSHVIINLDCTIGHDAIIGNYSTVLPSVNVSGYVKLSESVSLGTSCAVIQGISIGENTIIGAGAIVVKDIPSNCTAVGSPAKPIKFHNII